MQQHLLFQPHAFFLPCLNVGDISHHATHRSSIYVINASERNFTSSRSPQAELRGRAYRVPSNSRHFFKVVVSSTKRCNLSDFTKKSLLFYFFELASRTSPQETLKYFKVPFVHMGLVLHLKGTCWKFLDLVKLKASDESTKCSVNKWHHAKIW